MNRVKVNRSLGFTLVEMMAVVAIIGVLAAVALPSYQKYVEKNSISNGKLALGQLNLELQRYLSSQDSFGSAANRKTQVDNAVARLDDNARNNYAFAASNIIGEAAEGSTAYFILATPTAGKNLPHLWMSRTGDAYKCSSLAAATAQLKADTCTKI